MSENNNIKPNTILTDQPKQFGQGGHDYSVDMLRGFSCIMVVLIHCAGIFLNIGKYHLVEGASSSWYIISFYRSLFASPTVMFVMVSAIFLLTPSRNITIKKIWIKNVLKMATAYVGWCYIYAATQILIYTEDMPFSIITLTKEALNQPPHMWYIPMMIGLYVLTPILRLITSNFNIEIAKYGVILFAGALILNTLLELPHLPMNKAVEHILEVTPAEEICKYTAWFLFGYFIYTYRPTNRTRRIVYILGILSVFIAYFVNTWLYFDPITFAETQIIKKFTITTFCKNVAIFLFFVTVFKNYKPKGIAKFIIAKASSSTLIIYLAHWFFLQFMMHYEWLWDSGISPAILVLIYSLVAYVLGLLLSIAVQSVPWKKIRNKIWHLVFPNSQIFLSKKPY